MDSDIRTICEERARKGDGQFAIALALLELGREIANENHAIAKAIERLGTNDSLSPMGAIELLASEVKRIAEAVEVWEK